MMPSMVNCTQILEGMSEKIRMGIEAAQTDLSKEKEKKQQEEVKAFCMLWGQSYLTVLCCVCVTRFLQGLLRYVPIVGSVLSWFSPPTPTTPEGRTFSLSSGLWGVQWNLNCSMQGSISLPPPPSPLPPCIVCARGFGAILAKCPCSSCSLQERYKPPLVHTSTRCR